MACTPRRCCRARSPSGSPTCPGTGFYADGTGASHLRLSYCFPPPERIREGVRRLAGVVEQELALRAVFGADSGSGATTRRRHVDAGPQGIERRGHSGPGLK